MNPIFASRKRLACLRLSLLLLALGSLAAQTQAPPQQKLPSKDDPQGYSPEMFDQKVAKEVISTPKTYTPAKPIPRNPELEAELKQVIEKQFGSGFELFPDIPTPLLTGDLDGDGAQDAVIIVRSEKPLTQAALFNFKTYSPQEEYFGYGDPKVALSTPIEPWQERKMLLVIHGNGKEGWRSDTPKAKFLIVNIPFDRLSITHVKMKKKLLDVINAEETSVMSSVVYWTGKKYKWEPNTSVE